MEGNAHGCARESNLQPPPTTITCAILKDRNMHLVIFSQAQQTTIDMAGVSTEG